MDPELHSLPSAGSHTSPGIEDGTSLPPLSSPNYPHPNVANYLYGRQRSGSASAMTGRARSGSVKSARSHALSGGSIHFSPTNITTFNFPQVHHPTPALSTHAVGIQPSASFFHPSRPNHSTLRPPSIGSDSASFARTSITDDPHRHISTAARAKVSREPLLPIGGFSGTQKAFNPGSKMHPGNSSDRGGGSGGRVRNSWEKIFRQTSSVESQNKPNNHTERKATINGQFPSNFHPEMKANLNSGGHPRFAPLPPPPAVDITAVPVTNPRTGRPIRKWKFHPSQNIFFLQGRLLTGGDTPLTFIGSLILVFGIAGVWIGTTSVWWWQNESPAVAIIGAYLILVTISSMLATAFRDPGILPRGLDLDPPYPNTSPNDDAIRVPYPRDLKVRSGAVRVKYCQTCQIYRPPRSSHCRVCDNCVDGCDHHCQWVNNCVGRRNYTSFVAFMVSAVVTLCLFICTSALHISIQSRRDHISAHASLQKGAGSAVVFVLSAIVIWPMAGLLGYHIRLLALNLTTVEQIRNSAHRSLDQGPLPPNPFAFASWRHNFAEMLCRPQGLSWVNASAIATEDKREPNPGSAAQSQESDLEAGESDLPQAVPGR